MIQRRSFFKLVAVAAAVVATPLRKYVGIGGRVRIMVNGVPVPYDPSQPLRVVIDGDDGAKCAPIDLRVQSHVRFLGTEAMPYGMRIEAHGNGSLEFNGNVPGGHGIVMNGRGRRPAIHAIGGPERPIESWPKGGKYNVSLV